METLRHLLFAKEDDPKWTDVDQEHIISLFNEYQTQIPAGKNRKERMLSMTVSRLQHAFKSLLLAIIFSIDWEPINPQRQIQHGNQAYMITASSNLLISETCAALGLDPKEKNIPVVIMVDNFQSIDIHITVY